MTDLRSCTTSKEALRDTQKKLGHLLFKYDEGLLNSYEVVEKIRKVHEDLLALKKTLSDQKEI